MSNSNEEDKILTSSWCYHPEKQLLEWLSDYDAEIKEKAGENLKITSAHFKHTSEHLSLLHRNSNLNIYSKLATALKTAFHSKHVSSFQKQDILESVANVNSLMLNEANEFLDTNNLKKYFLFDSTDNKSFLVEEICNTAYVGFNYWDSILEHPLMDHFLDEVTPTKKFIQHPAKRFVHEYLIKLLAFVFSPIYSWSIILNLPFKKFFVVYPEFYFIACGQAFYTILAILFLEYFRKNSDNTVGFYFLWAFIFIQFLNKVIEEIFQFLELGDVDNSSTETSSHSSSYSFIYKLRAYLYDFWNYVDLLQILLMIVYLATSLVLLIHDARGYNILSKIHIPVSIGVLLTCSLIFAKISRYSKSPNSAVDATIIMIQVFLKYLIAILPIAFTMICSTLILQNEAKNAIKANQTETTQHTPVDFSKISLLSIRTLVGLNDPSDVLEYNSTSQQFFWVIWYLMVIVILMNGLISFMTTQLDFNFSKQFQRRQVNLDRIKLLGQVTQTKNVSEKDSKDEEAEAPIKLDKDLILPEVSLFYAQSVVSCLISQGVLKVNHKTEQKHETLFMLLAKMEYLLQNSSILRDQIAEYLIDNSRALTDLVEQPDGSRTTAFHEIFRQQNFTLLNLTTKWLNECSEDSEGLLPVQLTFQLKDKDSLLSFVSRLTVMYKRQKNFDISPIVDAAITSDHQFSVEAYQIITDNLKFDRETLKTQLARLLEENENISREIFYKFLEFFLRTKKLYSFLDFFSLVTSYKLIKNVWEPSLEFLKSWQAAILGENSKLKPVCNYHINSVSQPHAVFNICGGAMGEGAGVIMFHKSGGLNEEFLFMKHADTGYFSINCWYNPYICLILEHNAVKTILFDEKRKDLLYDVQHVDQDHFTIRHVASDSYLCNHNGRPGAKKVTGDEREPSILWKLLEKPGWNWPSLFANQHKAPQQ